MKNIFNFLILILVSCASLSPVFAQDKVLQAFENPSDEAHVGVFWYWVNGNISKEGIIADIKAMGDIGVKWAYLVDIGIHPEGEVINRSKEWYDMVKVALTEAKKEGVNIHLTSPGWAVSGGPWITPEKSMKEVVWTEAFVKGGENKTITLKEPSTYDNFYRDIAVLAFPASRGDNWGSTMELKPVVKDSSGNIVNNYELMFDENYETKVTTTNQFTVEFEDMTMVRSLYLRAARENGYYEATIEGYDMSEGTYVKLGSFKPNNAGPFSAQVGDITFPSFKTTKFRVSLSSPKAVIEDIVFYGSARMPDWLVKSGFGTHDITEKYTNPSSYPNINESDAIKTSSIIDLTNRMNARGELSWDVPEGEWIVQRIGYTSTGAHVYPAPVGGSGLETDKLNKEFTDYHYENAIHKTLKEVGSAAAESVKYHSMDSYEAGWQNWTQGFDNEFNARCDYDILTCLPAMTGRIIENTTITDKFYWDLRNVISDLFAENHYGQMAKNGKKDGIKFSTEPYAGPYNMLKVGAQADLPMVEFWTPSTQPRKRKIDFQGVYAGRTNGNKIIGAESFTSESPTARWNHHPYNLKATGDYVLTSGVNRLIMHVYTHQPFVKEHLKPGMTTGINGIHYDRNNTWWDNGGKGWNEYLSRSQALLQEGLHVADALYFQGKEAPAEPKWFEPQLPIGYDYDACHEDIFLKLSVKNGKVVLPTGKAYGYLVLPSHGWMSNASLTKTVELVKEGATVIGLVAEEAPGLADYVKGSGERIDAFKQLWGLDYQLAGDKKIGKGRLIWGKDFQEILSEDKLIPDFSYDEKSNLLINYIHRESDGKEIYFVANGKYKEGWVNCRFRINDEGMVPQFWHPDNGMVEDCAIYTRTKDYIEIPIFFEEAGSVFVIFKEQKEKDHLVTVLHNNRKIQDAVEEDARQENKPEKYRKGKVYDDFSISFWSKPSSEIELPVQTNKGIHWSGQNWAIYPSEGHNIYGAGDSGVGVSIGSNGVVLFEHFEMNVPPVLVHKFEKHKSDWFHVLVTYSKGVPSLYINGEFLAEGVKTGKRAHPSTFDENEQNKFYRGRIVDLYEFDHSLNNHNAIEFYNKLIKPDNRDESTSTPLKLRKIRNSMFGEFFEEGKYEFISAKKKKKVINITNITEPLELKNWKLNFPSGWGAPNQIELDSLISLSEHENEGVKYFSGTVSYKTTVELTSDALKSNKTFYLDLGQVNVIAEVIVNGENMGVYWKPPFMIDFTQIAKTGINDIEVKVTNLWVNRMIGDEQYPSDTEYGENGLVREWPDWLINDQPRPEKNRLTFSANSAWSKEDSLPSSGLIGPVFIRFIDNVKIDL